MGICGYATGGGAGSSSSGPIAPAPGPGRGHRHSARRSPPGAGLRAAEPGSVQVQDGSRAGACREGDELRARPRAVLDQAGAAPPPSASQEPAWQPPSPPPAPATQPPAQSGKTVKTTEPRPVRTSPPAPPPMMRSGSVDPWMLVTCRTAAERPRLAVPSATDDAGPLLLAALALLALVLASGSLVHLLARTDGSWRRA